jgi:hypothetical protein
MADNKDERERGAVAIEKIGSEAGKRDVLVNTPEKRTDGNGSTKGLNDGE